MTQDLTAGTALPFDSLPLSPELARAVVELGYTEATDIQTAAIPLLLDGKDVIGRSRTGTGKTAAFGIPAVEMVDGGLKLPQVLVLSPTRELAMQIALEMQKYAKYKPGVSVATVYGGASMVEQIRALRHANIVIGTPGRLMDHLRRRTLKLDSIKMVVLDEADEMLSMGFIEDIQTILSQAPSERQTVLFSATMPPPILKISKEFLHDPKLIDVVTGQVNKVDIEQTYYYVPQHNKQEALSLLLLYAQGSRSIVFCNTKSMVDEVAAFLRKQGFKAASLHGDMTQVMRSGVMQSFRNGTAQILIATDVAARGIDVSDIDSVINYDLPQSFEYYVHRIGRTGRAGKRGLSQTLVCNNKQIAVLKSLMNFTGSKIKECTLPTGQDMMERKVAKLYDELLPAMQGGSGKAAQMLVKRLAGAEGSDIEQVALALAERLVGGDSQFKTIAAPPPPQREREREHPSRSRDGKQPPMVTVSVSIGRSSRVTPNHFVGAIAELLDIPGSSIGKIDIEQNETHIGLREDTALALESHKKPIYINGQPVRFTLHRKRPDNQAFARPKRYGDRQQRPKKGRY